MSKSLAVAAVLLLLLGLQSVTLAAGPSNPVKWSQIPDMNDGYQFSSEQKVPSVVADDWVCPDGKPVTDIHWWGGYWTPGAGYGGYSDGRPSVTTPGTLQQFIIKIWSNAPADSSDPYDRPGAVLESYDFNLPEVHETFYGTTTTGRKLYQYYVDLPEAERFNQVQGVTYWLTIQADLPDSTTQWGWHESNDHHASPAVQDFKGAGWLQIRNNQYPNDMAFELTTVPEPAGLSVLGIGLTGMVSMLLKRRR